MRGTGWSFANLPVMMIDLDFVMILMLYEGNWMEPGWRTGVQQDCF